MPNPNNNQNEAQLSEVKKRLDEFEGHINRIYFDDQDLSKLHQRFKDALHELSKETDRYYTKDGQGNYPVMDAQAFTRFERLYRNAYGAATALETGLKKDDPAQLTNNDRIWKNVYDSMIDMVRDVLGQDFQHLHSVQRSGNETLPALIERARTHVYNVDGQNLERFGANMSSRLAITIPGENGNIRGFFTESITTNKEEEQQKLRQTTLAKCPALKEMLDNTVYHEEYDVQYTLPFAEEYLLSGIPDGNVVGWLRENLPNDKLRNKLLQDGELFTEYVSYRRQYDMLEAKYEKILKGQDLGQNDKMDQRNCAMSTMADMLGMPNLLAHAEPVQIQYTQNGETKTLSGSFMRFAEGQDIKGQQIGQGMLNVNAPVDTEAASLKQQIADLQVLDYICGNVDRHSGNMFYQLDESDPQHPRLTGIQGIDNDASFTAYSGEAQIGKITVPKSMGVIRSQTAAMVEGLDEDMLKTMLRNYHLSTEQIDAAWTRTQNLQKAIREGREFFRDRPENEVKSEHLHVIDDATFENVPMSSFSKITGISLFKAMRDVTGVTVERYGEDEKERLKQQVYASMSELNKESAKIKSLYQNLKDADSAFRRRPEYGVLRRTVKELKDMGRMYMPGLPQDSEHEEISQGSIEARLPAIRDALAAANAYLDHKQTEYSRERAEIREKYRTDGLSEKATKKAISKMNKALDEVREKYKGKNSAYAKRIRAAKDLRETLQKYLASGEATLKAFKEHARVHNFTRDEWKEEIQNRMQKQQEQVLQQASQAIHEPAQENRRGGRRMSVADLQKQLGLRDENKERKTVFENQEKQKEIKRSNSME